MAALAELFLVLAGFDTNLDLRQLQHTAEYDIFERGHRFGQRFIVLRDACASREDAIANTIETFVIQRYLKELAKLELNTLAELSKVARIPLGDALYRSVEIMDKSVNRWERRFEFSLRLLTQLDPRSITVSQSIQEVTEAARIHAGFSDVHELCIKCVEALDMQWLNDVKVSLTTFGASQYQASDLSLHPSLVGTRGAQILNDATMSVRHLTTGSAGELGGLAIQFLDVADANVRLFDSIEVPIAARQLVLVLEKIHKNILTLVGDRILHTKNVHAMLVFLRDILLFGSSAFVHEFCSAQCNSSLALDRLRDSDVAFASEIYAYVDPMIHFDSDSALLEVRWPLSLLFAPDQCTVYCSIHSTFAAVVGALNSIGPGQGTVMHAYYLFLAMLWSEFQNSVDVAFSELRNAIHADQNLSVQSTQSQILRGLVKKLCLDSSVIRDQLQVVVEHVEARSDTVKPVRDLAISLSKLAFGRELQLQPFLNLEGS